MSIPTPTSGADVPSTLAIPAELHELLIRSVPLMIKASGEAPEEALCRMLTMGFTECLKQEHKRLEKTIEIQRRHAEVEIAVSKMSRELPVTEEEVDLIWHAAKHGHLEAGYLVSDFKRFGHSMNYGKEDA